MRDILDPADQWLGSAPFALEIGNKFPVAIDDALSILKDGGPVSVDVLANDFDPEGQPLSLVSAIAALGTAVAEANGTVTYTPPDGISGFDTVVYTIVDDAGQTRTGQIDITITDPQLSIDQQADNTLVVNAETGLIDITITDPADFAGTYQVNTADLLGGPVNLAAPSVSGTLAPSEVLSTMAGLWIYDTATGTPTQNWQWYRNGAEIVGATQQSYTVTSADIGPSLSVAETLTDNFGQRSTFSTAMGTFVPSDDTALIGWWDADDASTISHTAGAVSAWADKAGGSALTQIDATRQPNTGTRTINGLNVIDFISGDFVERAETISASGNIAFHMAIELDGATNAFEAVLAMNAAVNDFQIDSNNATQFDGRMNLAGAGTPTTLTGGPFLGGLILSVIFDRTGTAQAEVYISNTLRGSTAYTASLDVNTALLVMSNRSKNAFSPGAIAELVITSDVSNRSNFHAYLATKWGLS